MVPDPRPGQSGLGLPSPSKIFIPEGAQRVTLSGTIQKVPASAEAMASWGLTLDDRAELATRGIYLRADRTSEKHEATKTLNHEGHEDHEDYNNLFQDFVFFVSFVVDPSS